MNLYPDFPEPLHWNVQELADAVPLRLFETCAFDAGSTAAANSDERFPQQPRRLLGHYRPAGPLPAMFRIHN